MNDLHVIVGAGQIGAPLAQRLTARGLRVRTIRRTAGPNAVSADVRDPEAAARAMEGAAVVYNVATPRYHKWTEELLPMTRGLVAGARSAGARVVALDNLYMYGAAGVMREDTPIAPCSKKGHLRAEAATVLLDSGATLLRASDFVGPGATMAAMFGDRFWQRLFAGKSVEAYGDPSLPHTYSFTPDVSAALELLGTTSGLSSRVWHLPSLPAEPSQTWIERFARAVDRSPRITPMAPFMLTLAGLFIPEAGEVREMLYQWRAPFILDGSAFAAKFGFAPTAMDRVVAETIAWARGQYERRAA